jgi:hypothetical protein
LYVSNEQVHAFAFNYIPIYAAYNYVWFVL